MKVNPPIAKIRTDEELKAAIKQYAGIDIPDVQVCPEHTTPFRALADAYFARSSVSIWYASRGLGGKSLTLAALAFMEGITLGASVNLLGGSGEQSERVHDYMTGQDTNMPDKFWGHPGAPTYLLASDPTMRHTQLKNYGKINVLMASQTSVRGGHPQRLRMDEIDEMDLSILDAAMGQTMEARGIKAQTVLSSTHQYADGTMTEALKRANEKGWPVYIWCWRETSQGWLSQDTINQKRLDVTEAMWNNEFDLQEPSPESRAIQPDAAERMFKRELGYYRGAPGEDILIEEHDQQGIYATGADWARKQDWTIILTFRLDCNPARLVAFKRMGRTAWPTMVSEYNRRVTQYGQPAAHDGTGIGDVVSGYLTVEADGVIMVGRTRSDMLTEYIAAIERGEIEAPFIEYMAGEHRYASTDDVYGSGHLPDTIAAGALAWYAATKPIVTHEIIYDRARIG